MGRQIQFAIIQVVPAQQIRSARKDQIVDAPTIVAVMAGLFSTAAVPIILVAVNVQH